MSSNNALQTVKLVRWEPGASSPMMVGTVIDA
jgi:hypothetical protein